jgi:hypothetical protein
LEEISRYRPRKVDAFGKSSMKASPGIGIDFNYAFNEFRYYEKFFKLIEK